jgi:hypothetical protein
MKEIIVIAEHRHDLSKRDLAGDGWVNLYPPFFGFSMPNSGFGEQEGNLHKD